MIGKYYFLPGMNFLTSGNRIISCIGWRNQSRHVERPVQMEFIRKHRKIVTMLGLISIVAGYYFLARGSISLAPALLVLGYCVLIPVALI